ncbi:MAG: WD40/YVTN/BNR-like repeat-containing protein, partial [Fimbriimonas sp.]
MKRFAPLLILLPFLLSGTLANAQTSQDGPTTLADGPLAPILANLFPRQLGPTTMGGRVVDIAVFEKDPRIFFVASASGGLWRTQNLGTTFEPIFDREATVSLGAVAVSQKDSNLIWVGTGEHTSRNSVAWGDGVYKTTDGGKTWKNMGLKATQFISEVIIDPRDNNVVYVAALGKLWGFNEERG